MDVVLVVMPFADVGRPAMGVSLLAAELNAAGHSARVAYCNLDLAARVSLPIYQQVANGYPPDLLVGEWLFADDVFGDDIPHSDDYLSQVLARKVALDADTVDQLANIRAVRASFLDDCVELTMRDEPALIGFTSTFHQTCPSLALARRLKELDDAPLVVFGGANCEGEMGLEMIRQFPWIDYLCGGESDVSFPSLVDALEAGDGADAIPGVLSRTRMDRAVRSAPVTDMDALPYPDFHDYFAGLDETGLASAFDPHLVVETSRGCWWGAKHHCTFCGLNGDTMAFRSKSPDRAFDEIVTLVETHDTPRVGCVDNILDMKYVRRLFPRLAETDIAFDIFYEVKANLRYAQLDEMRAGGLTQIQPGIESFSDSVLDLMRKGCSGLQNIRLLRWTAELGIEVAWNLLGGFPDEDPAEYERMAALIPSLTHLTPPTSCARLRLDRFSPFHDQPQEFGFARVRPSQAYFYVFPMGRRELQRLAYYFDFDYVDGRNPEIYLTPVQQAVGAWVAEHHRAEEEGGGARLDAYWRDGSWIIDDTRGGHDRRHRLTGLAAEVHSACDDIGNVSSLASKLHADEDAVAEALDVLMDDGLVVRDGDRHLSLAVFRKRPPRPDREPPADAAVHETPVALPLLDLV